MAWGRKQNDDRADDTNPGEQAMNADAAGDGAEEAQKQIAQLQVERDDLNSKYLRTLADYQNSQRRAAGNEREAELQGIKKITLNVLPVLDHFDLALNQDAGKASAEQIMSGVRVIRDELLKVLLSHGVGVINPEPGAEFDPTHHQAVVQVQSDEVPPGHIVRTLQAGYSLNDRPIRPAMVSVRPAEEQGGEQSPGEH